MFNGRKINDLLEEKKQTKASLYRFIGISKKGLNDIIDGNHIPKISYIESIADFFKIPIDALFDREIDIPAIKIGHQVKGNGNKVSGNIKLNECQAEIEHLKKLLQEKIDIINEKERTIQILMKQHS
ncbi:helix-turn-helix transcriptional regulator [Bacteroides pyogenes]|uniref:helix-turn-helix transcriptional regulator n=1 Tax=Bacteroides pyogenes TaxID=310300 RepID=UPI002A9186A2|nr:helix-turn-helix transcriptional regulator [Bacteroides pyogenes]MDY5433670.1 helix-turn-helix transcriptional regulator [Bacteroides pyogenes]